MGKRIFFLIVILIGFYLLFVKFVFWQITYKEELKFNKIKWFTKLEERYKYGKDLEKSKILLNLDSISLKNNIGEPTMRQLEFWDYDLGTSSEGLGFNFNNLKIKFNNGKVDSVLYSTYID